MAGTKKYIYIYRGCVKQFGKIICESWTGETSAVSASKALSNLAYRYKKEHGFTSSAKVELDKKYLEETGNFYYE
jgi:hypothetical protein